MFKVAEMFWSVWSKSLKLTFCFLAAFFVHGFIFSLPIKSEEKVKGATKN